MSHYEFKQPVSERLTDENGGMLEVNHPKGPSGLPHTFHNILGNMELKSAET